MNHDLIGEDGGITLYGFVNNEPIDLCDRLGLDPFDPNNGPNNVLGNFLSGLPYRPNNFDFGPNDPWTQQMKHHPWVGTVREIIKINLRLYCKQEPRALTEADSNFNLNALPPEENLKWFIRDAASQLTNGALGNPKAWTFGSYRLHWKAFDVSCCDHKARVRFDLRDSAHFGSAVRIPGQSVIFPDNTSRHGFFQTINMHWWWEETINFGNHSPF